MGSSWDDVVSQAGTRRRMLRVGLAVALVVGLVLVPQTNATTSYRYVSTRGSDANPGTATRPWRTIGKGFTAIRAGQTLFIRGGTYVQNFSGKLAKGTPTARIVVRSYPGERAVIRGLISFSAPSYWRIRNLWFTWNTGTYDGHMVRLVGGTGWLFYANRVWGSRDYACVFVGRNPHSWTIRGNIIHDCPGGQANLYQSHDLYVNTGALATGGLIERNILFNASHGSNIKLGFGVGTDLTRGTVNVVVRYNTLYSGVQPLLLSGPTLKNVQIYRNIIDRATRPDMTYLVRLYGIVSGANIGVHHNLGYGASVWCRDLSGGMKCAQVNGGANVFPRSPRFDSVLASGFHPLDTIARAYGRYAP
jgi:hypothetical protein